MDIGLVGVGLLDVVLAVVLDVVFAVVVGAILAVVLAVVIARTLAVDVLWPWSLTCATATAMPAMNPARTQRPRTI